MHLKGGVFSLKRTIGNPFMSKVLGKVQLSVAISEKFVLIFLNQIKRN